MAAPVHIPCRAFSVFHPSDHNARESRAEIPLSIGIEVNCRCRPPVGGSAPAEGASWSPCASSWTHPDVQMQDHAAHGRLVGSQFKCLVPVQMSGAASGTATTFWCYQGRSTNFQGSGAAVSLTNTDIGAEFISQGPWAHDSVCTSILTPILGVYACCCCAQHMQLLSSKSLLAG